MAYIDHNLIENESVVYRAKLHWIFFLKPAFFALVLIAASSAFFYFASQVSENGATAMRWIGGALIVLAAISIVVAVIRRSSREYAVTNKRVVCANRHFQQKHRRNVHQ